MSGWLREQIVRLGTGNKVEREAAYQARRSFAHAAEVGPHEIAADYGAACDATLPEVAHLFASGFASPQFIDIAAQAAEEGFVLHLAIERQTNGITFEGVREIAAEWGPWPLADGEKTTQEIAEALADRNPELDRAVVIAAALLGFEEHLERLRASTEG